jgi:hypothetical protein
MLVENPIQRYKFGSDTPGFVKRADGSFEVYLQNERPAGKAAANWLPTPKGGYYIILRLYQPRAETLRGDWALPQIEPVE